MADEIYKSLSEEEKKTHGAISAIIVAYSHAERPDEMEQIVQIVRDGKVTIDRQLCNTIVGSYARLGNFTDAFGILTQMRKEWRLKPDRNTYRSLLDGLLYSPSTTWTHLEKCLENMDQDKVTEVYLFNMMMVLSNRLGQYEQTMKFYQRIKKKKLRADTNTLHQMLIAQGKQGKTTGMLSLLSLMREKALPTLQTFHIVIDFLRRNQDSHAVFRVFQRLLASGLPPTEKTFVSVFSALSQGRHFQDLLLTYREMKSRGTKVTPRLYMVLLSALRKTDDVQLQEEIIGDLLREPHLLTPEIWGELLFLASKDNPEQAERYLQLLEDYPPSSHPSLLNSLVTVYAKYFNLEEAFRYFEELEQKQLRVRQVALESLIRGCGKFQKLERLPQVLSHIIKKDIPFTPSIVFATAECFVMNRGFQRALEFLKLQEQKGVQLFPDQKEVLVELTGDAHPPLVSYLNPSPLPPRREFGRTFVIKRENKL